MAPKRRAPEMPPPAMEEFSTLSRESAISVKRSAGGEKENGDAKKPLFVETTKYSAETIYCVKQLIKFSGNVGRLESAMMEGMELISASNKSDWVARGKTLDFEALGILVEKLELLLEMNKMIYLALKSKMNK